MHVRESTGSELIWTSHDHKGNVWFSCKFDLLDFEATATSDPELSKTLRQILKAACRLNSDFLSKWKKYKVDTYLEFDRAWGLGSSSTLISCISQWAEVNPYYLLFNTMGGSGYDIACAQADGPLLYQLGEDELSIDYVDFEPAFSHALYLVYLGQKQSSDDARKHYYKHKANANGAIGEISEISLKFNTHKTLSSFEDSMELHEKIISKSLNLPTVKALRFADYWGSVKSLGAWGGDFVLATSEEGIDKTRAYFASKGLQTLFLLDDLVLETTTA